MSAITFTGLASGLDTGTLVTKLMSIEKVPQDLLAAKQAKAQSRLDHLGTLSTKLLALSAATTDLTTADFQTSTFAAVAATSSDAATFSATAAAGAAAGTYSLDVVNLASAQQRGGGDFDAAHGAGTLTIDGTRGQAVITVAANATAADVAKAINADPKSGLSASLLDGRLLLSGKKTGAAENYTLSASGLTLDQLGLQVDPNDVAADDARLKVAGKTIARPTNTFADVPTGVTVVAKAVGSGKQLAVAADSAAAVTKVKAMVTAFNSVITQLTTDTSYDATSKAGGVLLGDSFAQGLGSKLARMVTDNFDPSSGGNRGYGSYVTVGLSFGRDGKLALDEEKLKNALAADPQAVQTLFAREDGLTASAAGHPEQHLISAGTATQQGDGIANRLHALVDQLTSASSAYNPVSNGKRVQGSLLALKSGAQASITDMGNRMTSMQTRLDQREAYLRSQFTAMEQAISKMKSQSSYLTATST